MTARGSRLERGFTLLEAVVAMVLLAMLGGALFTWMNTNLMSLSSVREANIRNEAQANVLAYLANVNPMQQPEGKADLGSYQAVWKSVPIVEKRNGVAYMYGESLYELALYEMSVSVRRQDGAAWFDFKVKQVGYKRTRELVNPFMGGK